MHISQINDFIKCTVKYYIVEELIADMYCLMFGNQCGMFEFTSF